MDAWTRYWQADRLHSCIAAEPAVEQQVAEHWVRFGRSLAPGTRLVDLATGNGAVPAALLTAGLALDITALDKARIDPPAYLSQGSMLRGVQFAGGVDLADPAAWPGRYDAVTSQFGVEYLPAAARAPAVACRLHAGGRFQLLLHHADSEIVGPRRRDLEELCRLLQPNGVIPTLRGYAGGDVDSAELEGCIRRYLHQPGTRTRRLSGDLLTSIGRILAARRENAGQGAAMAADLCTRVEQEALRLRELETAAAGEAEVQALAEALSRHGMTVTACEPLRVTAGDGAALLLGWHLAGHTERQAGSPCALDDG